MEHSGMEEEVQVGDDEFIISRTDLKGIITYASDSFCKLSGYAKEELIGKPHSIVRHRDMPKIAFKELWDTVKSGGTWRGYVKNRTKNGKYYWVEAEVSPHIVEGRLVGYKSIRTKPDRATVEEKSRLYAKLLEKERGFICQEGVSSDLLSEDQRLEVLELAHRFKMAPDKLIDKMIDLMEQVYRKMQKR